MRAPQARNTFPSVQAYSVKTQSLWGRVPFSSLTPNPRGNPALGGWGRTENPGPAGRSPSWENSTAQQKLPFRKAGRPGGRGFWGGGGSEKAAPASSDFSVSPRPGSALPGSPREELASFPRSTGCAGTPHPLLIMATALLCPRDPPSNTRAYTHLRPCCRAVRGAAESARQGRHSRAAGEGRRAVAQTPAKSLRGSLS